MDLVIDHSVQIDHYDSPAALAGNMRLEFARNGERYRFIKWGMQAFHGLAVVPPGIGIVHQVNLELLARPLWLRDGVHFPDSLVGTDSHTTMINGLGVLGWGVGGIEAEAAMLGQPVFLGMPDVVGVRLRGGLAAGATATDAVLHLTAALRKAGVVGAFVEFFGSGAAALSVPDRATIANMAPEYGATVGFFPTDERTLGYFIATGRDPQEVAALRAYLKAQGMFGMPEPGHIGYSATIDVDLDRVVPCVAGPRRPQDLVPLTEAKARFAELFSRAPADGGYGKAPGLLAQRFPLARPAGQVAIPAAPVPAAEGALAGSRGVAGATGGARTGRDEGDDGAHELAESARPGPAPPPRAASGRAGPCPASIGHGDVLIAAITSCTNTSNPGVMLAAGLLARNACARGLHVGSRVKTSLAPGSRVVTAYLQSTGLLPYLEQLGFGVSAYGCTTCIGNSGPLDPAIEAAIGAHDLICAAVLSGNRNYEARIHPSLRANFLMSPPLVVAYAIAGRLGVDLASEPLGTGTGGRPVYLRDIWPTAAQIEALLPQALLPGVYQERYRDPAHGNPLWDAVPAPGGDLYAWDPSTYIAERPLLRRLQPGAGAARAAARGTRPGHPRRFGHHRPPQPGRSDRRRLPCRTLSPGARHRAERDFSYYGARRGNHEVMMRGFLAHGRLRNLMVPAEPDGSPGRGGQTIHHPSAERMAIYDAAMRYQGEGTPTLIIAGAEYGSGSSRDWAAKGARLLGVRAVVAKSFERIHRSNLIGMGVLPLQFCAPDDAAALALRGDESFSIPGVEAGIAPRQQLALIAESAHGGRTQARVLARLDTPIEAAYLRHGGIMPYALRRLLSGRFSAAG